VRACVDAWRANGDRIAFVPTMGALHRGHVSLVETGRQSADRVVASIFVNPKQFAAHEDLSTYPRRELEDLSMLAAAECDLAWCPTPDAMYPIGFSTSVTPGAPAEGLEAAARPHFFGGVATVVLKLLNQVRPDIAIFGEKDFQQLLVVRAMARDFDLPMEIRGAPTVREPDGLALSSRNAYLTETERRTASALSQTLFEAAEMLARGARVDEAERRGRSQLAAAGFDRVDYFEVRMAADLGVPGRGPLEIGAPARVLAAALLGRTRLIDNVEAIRRD